MGYRACFIGAKLPPQQMAEKLGLPLAHSVDDMPEGDSWIATVKRSGWTVARLEGEAFFFENMEHLTTLSRHGDIIVCYLNETVMCSSATYLRDGAPLWSLTHVGTDGERTIDETGDLPDGYAALKAETLTEQEADTRGVDHIFDLPLDTAGLYLQFWYASYLVPEDTDGFHLIDGETRPAPQSLLGKLFGKPW